MPAEALDFTARQALLDGWRQDGLSATRLAVVGAGLTGMLTVAAADMLGVGEIMWIGRLTPSLTALAELLVPSLPGTLVDRHRRDPVSSEELEWAVGPADIVIACGGQPDGRTNELAKAGRAAAVWSADGGDGGWFGRPAEGPARGSCEEPAAALGAAAMAVDWIREARALPLGDPPATGTLGLCGALPPGNGPLVVVGCGGIGTWVAVGLLLAGAQTLCLIDHDHVESTNLNRQALFTIADVVARRPKARALAVALRRAFPEAQITGHVLKVDERHAEIVGALAPVAVLACVDNSTARLALQDACAASGTLLVDGRTGPFAAEVVAQRPGGPTLDQISDGALSASAERSGRGPARRRGCGEGMWVVPGMMAAAGMLASLGSAGETGWSWHAGSLPRRTSS